MKMATDKLKMNYKSKN